MHSNSEAAVTAWSKCFAKEGRNCKIVVGDREFSAWSSLLCAWSDTFEAILIRNECKEKDTSRIVIEDFSAESVEAVLRFLHTGTIDLKPELMVEVGALADKYCIDALHKICTEGISDQITCDTVCMLMQKAHEIHSSTVKDECMTFALSSANDALPYAFDLSEDLLDEMLSSDRLCIHDFDLAMILLRWKEHPDCKHDVASLLRKHVQVAAFDENQSSKVETYASSVGLGDLLKKMKRKRKRGEVTKNVFESLLSRYRSQFPSCNPSDFPRAMQPPFLGYWVNLIPGHASFCSVPASSLYGICLRERSSGNCSSKCLNQVKVMHRMPAQALQEAACGGKVSLEMNQELTWMLPHHSIIVSCISFPGDIQANVDFEILCSVRGTDWQLLSQVRTEERKSNISIPHRGKDSVKRFKLRVKQGCFNNSLVVSGTLLDE